MVVVMRGFRMGMYTRVSLLRGRRMGRACLHGHMGRYMMGSGSWGLSRDTGYGGQLMGTHI